MVNTETQSQLKNSFIWNSLNKFGTIIIQFISIIVLSRILEKKDFALMGIVLFITTISSIIIDSGMGGSLVRAKEVSKKDYSTLFYYNFFISLVIGLVLLFFTKNISEFYKSPELNSIIVVLSFSIIVSSFGKVQTTIMMRNLDFKGLGVIALISSFLSLIFALIIAYNGGGVWSLVFQNVLFNIFTVIFLSYKVRFVPSMVFCLKSFKEQWQFGCHLFTSNILNTIYNNVFLTIFPRISTLTYAANYTQASKLQQLPINIFSNIIDNAIFPVLSKLDDREQMKVFYRSLVKNIYIITFSILTLLLVNRDEVIMIVLGKKWKDISYMFFLLSLSSFFLLIMACIRSFLKSCNLTKGIFKSELLKIIFGTLVFIMFFSKGGDAIIMGVLISNVLGCVGSMCLVSLLTTYSFVEQMKDILKPSALVLLCSLLTFLLCEFIAVDGLLKIIISIVVYSVSFLVLGFFTKNELVKYLLKIIRK